MTELNQVGFERLLGLLEVDRDQPAEKNKYLILCRTLKSYFERKGARDADELTDETISRVTKRLASGTEKGEEEIRNIAAFCQQFAKLILLEYYRSENEEPKHEVPPDLPGKQVEPNEELLRQQRFVCMRHCLQSLKNRERELVTQNCTSEDRAELAARLGLTILALRMRVFQIRKKLRQCVTRCMKKLA
ncbi:MAG: RNA polymerase sigma factor [Blastocatellia bacterium]